MKLKVRSYTSINAFYSGLEIGAFNIGGKFHAVRDFCPHLGASLVEGELHGAVVVCPLHYAKFDVTNGAIVRGPSKRNLDLYPVKVEQQIVFVGLRHSQIPKNW